jgi:hypothetical protein
VEKERIVINDEELVEGKAAGHFCGRRADAVNSPRDLIDAGLRVSVRDHLVLPYEGPLIGRFLI